VTTTTVWSKQDYNADKLSTQVKPSYGDWKLNHRGETLKGKAEQAKARARAQHACGLARSAAPGLSGARASQGEVKKRTTTV
jgi:hypothetical protein